MNAPEQLKSLLPARTGPFSGQEVAHESAVLHVTGEATFTDDIPEMRGTLYAALVTSPVAHGRLVGPHNGVDKAALLAEHVVVAREMVYAREAARKARLNIEELPAIITIEQALEAQSYVMPSKSVTRGDAAAALAAAPHRVKGTTRTGQQEQFYREGHISYVVPREDGQLRSEEHTSELQ